MENNEFYDRHLNLFISYGSRKVYEYNDDIDDLDYKEKIIENNVSRVLARLCMEKDKIYLNFQERLLDKIGVSGDITEVFFQVRNDKIRARLKDIKINKIIPVTLTEFNGSSVNSKVDFDKNSGNYCIPDIVLRVDDTLVFIEVKKTREDATNQVLEQIYNFNKTSLDSGDVVKIYWNQVTNILNNLPRKDIVINDYLLFLRRYFPEWFMDKMTDIIPNKNNLLIEYDDSDVSNPINVRLFNLLKKYCNMDDKMSYKYLRVRRAIGIECLFASEMQFRFNKLNNSIEVHMWTGETKYFLLEYLKYKKNNVDKIDKFKKYNDNGISTKIRPYVLFRDDFRYIDHMDVDLDIEIPDVFIKKMSKRKNIYDYMKYMEENRDEIEKYIPLMFNKIEEVEDKFYKGSDRKNIMVTIGEHMVISYPYAYYSKLESKTSSDYSVDGLDELVWHSLKLYGDCYEVSLRKN